MPCLVSVMVMMPCLGWLVDMTDPPHWGSWPHPTASVCSVFGWSPIAGGLRVWVRRGNVSAVVFAVRGGWSLGRQTLASD